MAHMPARIRYTYTDYKSLPEDQRCELLDGELIKMPSPTPRHQDITLNLIVQLHEFIRGKRLGKLYLPPLDVVLGDDVAQPDLLFISHKRLGIVDDQEIRGAPDLTIEILSPSTAARDGVTSEPSTPAMRFGSTGWFRCRDGRGFIGRCGRIQ